MNKTALKNFATNARKELIEKVKAKAFKIGITEENIKKAQFESSDVIYIDGKQLSVTEKKQREKLISRIKEIGFAQVVEEVSYTFFNRFTALRFMELNNYLPTKVRVLSSSNPDSSEPDIIKEALTVDLDIDKELVYELKINNKTEELFKYLLIKQCNSLNKVLPFMFETIDDYKEILFPEGLLAKDSFLREMINTDKIPETDWEQVEIIGWLYQFYIADEKDRINKDKSRHKKEDIPNATQLFTPKWIVRYMVQNSLGRYWVDLHPEDQELTNNWEFYLENHLVASGHVFENSQKLKIEDIKCLDPAMGSGHILVYMFDVLFEIYSKCGYLEREIPRLIIENNLYGLDIDDRAYQLACFSIVMKALKHNNRFLRSIEREGLILNLASIKETNNFNQDDINYFAKGSEDGLQIFGEFIEHFYDAKIYGSLLKSRDFDLDFIENRLNHILNTPPEFLEEVSSRDKMQNQLSDVIKQARIMNMKYNILISNPPYIGSGKMNDKLFSLLNKEYNDSKSDTCTAFMELDYLTDDGLLAMVNQHSWMFLSRLRKLREKLINNKSIYSMLHLGPRAFEEIGGEVVQTTAFVLGNSKKEDFIGDYIRLIDFKDSTEKENAILRAVENRNVEYRYRTSVTKFQKTPGNQIAYWISDKIVELFTLNRFEEYGNARVGLDTGNNDRFLRYWFEVSKEKILFNAKNKEDVHNSDSKWVPHTKGGTYRKWYGNFDYVIAFDNENYRLLLDAGNHLPSREFYFLEGFNWSRISTTKFAVRYTPVGFVFNSVSPTAFVRQEDMLYFISLMNTKLISYLLQLINPTLHFEAGNINVLPIFYNQDDELKNKVDKLAESCIRISKCDWDSFEISWDFKVHPLLLFKDYEKKIDKSFHSWSEFTKVKFEELKSKEDELNRIFNNAYNIHDEMTFDVEEEDITINKASREREIKSFISYAVGCMFGRYSLDEEGIVLAGGLLKPERYQTFSVDKDNIIPALSDAYFEDDIVSRFIDFVKVTFSGETLEVNVDFIAKSLGMKDGETANETIRRYFLNEFFKDHFQTYKKKPIYWLFTSGKQKAFNCIIYMHRYDKSTLSRIRTDYLHEFQIRMDAEKKTLLDIINGDGTTKEIANAKKELKSLDLKIEELRAYDEKLHHMADMQIEIDLDDGVAVNYAKFDGLLAPIK